MRSLQILQQTLDSSRKTPRRRTFLRRNVKRDVTRRERTLFDDLLFFVVVSTGANESVESTTEEHFFHSSLHASHRRHHRTRDTPHARLDTDTDTTRCAARTVFLRLPHRTRRHGPMDDDRNERGRCHCSVQSER